MGRNFAPRKWFCYKHFCLNRKDEKKQKKFLARYQQGDSQPVEDKLIERRYFDETLQSLCVNFSQYGDNNRFSDSQSLVSDFFNGI